MTKYRTSALNVRQKRSKGLATAAEVTGKNSESGDDDTGFSPLLNKGTPTMADQPTEEQLKAAFQLHQSLIEGFWAHWKTIQKSTNDHHELGKQTIIAALQMAAVLTVDLNQDPAVPKAQFDELYRQAYAKAPKFS